MYLTSLYSLLGLLSKDVSTKGHGVVALAARWKAVDQNTPIFVQCQVYCWLGRLDCLISPPVKKLRKLICFFMLHHVSRGKFPKCSTEETLSIPGRRGMRRKLCFFRTPGMKIPRRNSPLLKGLVCHNCINQITVSAVS